MAENRWVCYIYLMNNRGQNIFEYVLVTATVVIVFVALLASGGRFHQAVNSSVNSIVPLIDQGTNAIQFTGAGAGDPIIGPGDGGDNGGNNGGDNGGGRDPSQQD